VYKSKEINTYFTTIFGEHSKNYLISNGLINAIENLDQKNRDINKIKIIMQRKFNNSIFKEMCKIEDFCRKKNIRHIFLKGLVLAHQLYDCPEERKFGDIDIFVHTDDLYKFETYLIDAKYLNEENDPLVNRDVFKYYIPIHLSAFHKENIVLEIHIIPYYTNTFSNAFLGREKLDKFFEMKQEVKINNVYFPTLNPTANALFLLDHFIKHITYNIRDYTQGRGCHIEIEISKLDEAVFFIEKHKVKLNSLLELAKDYNSIPVLLLACKYMKEVFSTFYDDNAYIHLDSQKIIDEYVIKLPFYENKVIRKLYKITLGDVIHNAQNIKYIDSFIKSIKTTPSHHIKIPKKSDGVCGRKFYLNTHEPTNLFGTHYLQKNFDYNDAIFIVSGVTDWDEKGINFNIVVKDETSPDNDGIVFSFIYFNNFNIPHTVREIIIRMQENQDITKVNYDYIQEGLGDWRLLKNVYFSAIDHCCYSCIFSIPWEILGIRPIIGEQLYFELSFLRKQRETVWDRIMLGSIDRVLDPYSFSLLEISEL